MNLASQWWFWVVAAGVLGLSAVSSGRYRALVRNLRRSAVRRGLVELPAGRTLEAGDRGFWSNPSWLGFPAAVWVILSPWIWGYDSVDGAIATDAATGGAVIALALAGIVLPSLWALNVLAGLWLVTAPWLVGYGDRNGPVGLSDVVAGLVIAAVALATLAAAERQITQGGGPRFVGRISPRDRSS